MYRNFLEDIIGVEIDQQMAEESLIGIQELKKKIFICVRCVNAFEAMYLHVNSNVLCTCFDFQAVIPFTYFQVTGNKRC